MRRSPISRLGAHVFEVCLSHKDREALVLRQFCDDVRQCFAWHSCQEFPFLLELVADIQRVQPVARRLRLRIQLYRALQVGTCQRLVVEINLRLACVDDQVGSDSCEEIRVAALVENRPHPGGVRAARCFRVPRVDDIAESEAVRAEDRLRIQGAQVRSPTPFRFLGPALQEQLLCEWLVCYVKKPGGSPQRIRLGIWARCIGQPELLGCLVPLEDQSASRAARRISGRGCASASQSPDGSRSARGSAAVARQSSSRLPACACQRCQAHRRRGASQLSRDPPDCAATAIRALLPAPTSSRERPSGRLGIARPLSAVQRVGVFAPQLVGQAVAGWSGMPPRPSLRSRSRRQRAICARAISSSFSGQEEFDRFDG